MKITDLFSRIQKGSSGADGGKTARLIQPVQPVGHVGKLTLVPGQLLQGEVVGEDANGLLLLKLAGEVISARTAMKLEVGQQFWFEVKEAGDSPLLNLASQKGAIQDLLKDIMATRPLLVKAQPAAPSSSSATLQTEAVPGGAPGLLSAAPTTPSAAKVPEHLPSSGAGGQPVLASPVIATDGSLPPEAARLVRALVAYMDQPGAVGVIKGKEGAQQPPPLIKTIVSLIREGQVPASLQKIEAFQGVILPRQPFTAPLSLEGQGNQTVTARGEFSSSSPVAPKASSQPQVTSAPAPAVFSPETIKILNALVAVAGIKAPINGNGGPLQPALNPDQNLTEILTLIGRQDKIPVPLQKLAPLQVLMHPSTAAAPGLKSGQIPSAFAEKNEIPEPGLPVATAMLPLQFAAAQQGAESLPSQLRLLASLMGLGARGPDMAGWKEVEEMFGRLSETEMPAAARKLASFFEAHARVNTEAAPQGQSDFYIMPALFTGQAGWGEWLWSREHSSGDNDASSQESLVFFLEMSNLGALTIQVILKEKKLRGQILMADKKSSELVAALLPSLQERLEAFGYDVVDFSCSCQPLNVMQELKESLHSQAGSGPVSLLDVQA